MTKTQQKLARQATLFINCGGKAVTSLVSILLLLMAVMFEAASRFFLLIENAMMTDAREGEQARNRNRVVAFKFASVPGGGDQIRFEEARQPAEVLDRAAR